MRSLLTVCLALAATGAWAQTPAAHAHGVATLQVTLDGRSLELSLQTPLDNLLGFERGPRNDQERRAVRSMAQRFHAPAGLFRPTPAARCVPGDSTLSSAVIDATLLAAAGAAAPAGTPASAAGAGAGNDGHAELDATVHFDCANPAALKGVDVLLFQAFPRLRRIEAAVVTPTTQRGATLTPRQATLNW